MVTRPRLWLKTTSEKGPHLSCVVFTHLSRHQCTRRMVLQSVPAKGCSTGGHFLPLRNQRHIEVGRPLGSVSTGSAEYAGTLLHTCQLEDLRATSNPVRHSPAPVQVHYNEV